MSTSYKYPRTPHLPWSPGASGDDLHLTSHKNFEAQAVVVTEKLDGENTSLYRNHIHARSLDSRHHPSRDWVKALHGNIKHLIPEGWRVCGENVYAKHSVYYANLTSYFYVFSVWDEDNTCLAWDDTLVWAAKLGLEPVPVLYEGNWDELPIKTLPLNLEKQEGYVVRKRAAFPYADFSNSVAKWVRKNHVQTDQHWMHAEVIPNKLKES